MSQDYEKLIFEQAGSVVTITLNRPEVHNALDRQMSAELSDAIRRIKHDRSVRVLLLRGAGDTFCAGDDLKDFQTWTEDDPYWQVRIYQETVANISELAAITIAAADGVIAGGGLELTLVCDFVVATDRSRWGMPEVDWDITPGWGGTSRLARYAGRRKAKEWNLLGNLFDAATAERYNLVNRVCPPEQLDAEVKQLIDVILAKDPDTLRRTKFVLDQGADLHVRGALALELPVRPFPIKKPGSFVTEGLEIFSDRERRRERRSAAESMWQN